MATLQSILVPLDGSAPSLQALEHAIALADDTGARVEILHVIPLEDPLSPDVRLELERDMDDAVERARGSLGARVVQRSVNGDPLREILEAAHGFDLIIMGTHGRVGRIRSMLGSVAEGVVRNASCPVLTVRDASPGYEGFAERRHHRASMAEQTH